MVSKNHGYKWFAVMVFTLSRLEHGRLRRNLVCCGPVYGRWLSLRLGYGPVYNSRSSLRVVPVFGPVCTQHISSRTATSPMPSTLGMHSPLLSNSSVLLHPPSPQQPPLVCRLHILEALAASFLLHSNDGVVRLKHPWFNFRNTICSAFNGPMLARKVSIKNYSEEKLRSASQLIASTPW